MTICVQSAHREQQQEVAKAMTMTEPQVSELTYRDLIPPELWDRIVARIEREYDDIDHELAARILNEALGFLKYVAENPGESSAPSKPVDIGWHMLILYTRGYHDLCMQLAGHYLHHEPSDQLGKIYPKGGVGRTAEVMELMGFKVDRQLWTAGGYCSESCVGDTQCNCAGGCGGCGG